MLIPRGPVQGRTGMSTGVAENSIKKVLAGDLLTLKQVAPRFEDVPAEALTGAELFAIIRGKRGTRERDLRLITHGLPRNITPWLR